MDWRALLHDKRFQYAGAAAAAVGGYVLWQRHKTGATGSSTSPYAAAAPTGNPSAAGGIGTFNSTGSDVANWLGNQEGVLQDQQTAFLNQLQNVYNPPTQGPNTVTVPQGTYLYQWVSQEQAANPGFNFEQLRALNPGIDKSINWKDPGTPGNVNGPDYTPYLNQQTAIRVR
jgi:hypothetical protein